MVDQIGAAIFARLVLARGMKQPELVRHVRHLQNRYLSAVGASAYARYAAGAPSLRADDPGLNKPQWRGSYCAG